jgi:hypothetical protein
MSSTFHRDVHEDRQSLWMLVTPPAIWALHFLASYAGVAVWCGTVGRDRPLGMLGIVFWIFTAFAVAGIVLAGRKGWRRNRHGSTGQTHHQDTAEDRHRFLGLATVLLAALSAVATLYVAIAFALIGSCS